MTDLNDRERVERATRAERALAEFIAPAFAVVEAEYAEKMIAAAVSTDPRTPEVIARLANGIKVARQVKAQIEALVYDGEMARSQMVKAERIGNLSEPARRLLNIGAN